MTTVDPFIYSLPKAFREDPELHAWGDYLTQFLRELWVRSGGSEDVVGDTVDTVVTHSEKLEFITVTQDVNLDTLEAQSGASAATLATLATSSPTYTPSNDGTDRTWNANQAAGAISVTPTQAEVENLRDSILVLSDVIATLVRDLAAKNVIDT
jgi:hypothetical protein